MTSESSNMIHRIDVRSSENNQPHPIGSRPDRSFVGHRKGWQPILPISSAILVLYITVPNGWGVEPPRRSQAISAPSGGGCLPAQR